MGSLDNIEVSNEDLRTRMIELQGGQFLLESSFVNIIGGSIDTRNITYKIINGHC